MKEISVVAGICYRQNSILLGKRHDSEGRFAGYWEFPGGKIEDGESEIEALRREFQEELGCDIERHELFENLDWHYPDRKVALSFYLVRLSCEDTTRLELNAHSELMWVELQKAQELSVLPANIIILNKLVKSRDRLETFSS